VQRAPASVPEHWPNCLSVSANHERLLSVAR
jgi:hypothetical protein